MNNIGALLLMAYNNRGALQSVPIARRAKRGTEFDINRRLLER